MPRTLEALREEIFALDEASQSQLMTDIDAHLAEHGRMDVWMQRGRERLAEHRRGEGSYVTAEEMFAMGRKIIENAERQGA